MDWGVVISIERSEFGLGNDHHEGSRVVEMAAEMGAVSVSGAGGGIVCTFSGLSAGAQHGAEFLQVGRAAQ